MGVKGTTERAAALVKCRLKAMPAEALAITIRGRSGYPNIQRTEKVPLEDIAAPSRWTEKYIETGVKHRKI